MNCFELLGLPKKAALGEDEIQRAYAQHSRAAHPDHGGNEALAAQINAAYETLRAPEKRLKHLIELAAPDDVKAWRTVPLDEAMMHLFSQLGGALETTAKFLERKSKASSALARALLANEEMQHRETLEHIGFEIEARRNALNAQLVELDLALKSNSAEAWKHLATMQAKFAYLAKWQSELREWLLALM